MEKVESFKFFGVHITDKLKWSTHTGIVVRKAQQCLFNLRRLRKFGLAPESLTNFYRCTIENILSAVSLPGTTTAPPVTAGLSRGWCGLPDANYLPFMTPRAPNVTGRPKSSSRLGPRD